MLVQLGPGSGVGPPRQTEGVSKQHSNQADPARFGNGGGLGTERQRRDGCSVAWSHYADFWRERLGSCAPLGQTLEDLRESVARRSLAQRVLLASRRASTSASGVSDSSDARPGADEIEKAWKRLLDKFQHRHRKFES